MRSRRCERLAMSAGRCLAVRTSVALFVPPFTLAERRLSAEAGSWPKQNALPGSDATVQALPFCLVAAHADIVALLLLRLAGAL